MSLRLFSRVLGEETRDAIFKELHIKGDHTWHEIMQNKKYNKPLPDRSIDCFSYNKAEETIDVPFTYGKKIYNGFNANKVNSKTQLESGLFKGEPREEQITLLEEAKQKLDEHDCILIHMRPGGGKTFCSIKLGLGEEKPIMAVMNRRSLIPQWVKAVKRFSSAVVWVVGEKVPEERVDFIIVMIDSLKKMEESFLNRIGIVILDEAHMLMTPTQIPSILRLHPEKLILCTATPDRDVRTTTLLNQFCPHRVVRRYDGYLKVIYFNTNLFIDCKLQRDGKTPMWSDFVKQQQENEVRNQMAVEWVMRNKGKKTLGMTWGKNHAPHLSSLINEREEGKCDWFSSTKKKYIDRDVLVGSFGKIGTGFDPAANDDWDELHYDLMLMLGTTRSLALGEQLWGRAFRSPNPVVVVFIDNNTTSQNHKKELNKIAKLYQAEIVETSDILTL